VTRTHHNTITLALVCLASALPGCAEPGDTGEPDPAPRPSAIRPDAVTTAFAASTMITGVTWNFTSRVQMASGSDLWPLTWGSDGQVWGGWGDGGGFQGNDTSGRVSVGFAKLAGTPPNVVGTNLWGASPSFAKFPATFCGKPEAMLSVHGTLYSWVAAAYNGGSADFFKCPANPSPNETRLAVSTDAGAHFTAAPFVIAHTAGTIQPKRFINFGKDYAGARDGFVYLGATKVTNTATDDADGKAYLIRVPAASLQTMSAWEYMTGLDANGVPTWGAASAAQPMWSDPDFGFAALTYHPATNRYLLSGQGSIQDLAIYDAPQPWGPWTTVYATHTWGPSGSPFGTGESLGISYPEAWMSGDGKTLWAAFSSTPGPVGDALNLMSATLTLNNRGVTITSPIAYAQTQAAVGNRLYTDRIYTVNTLSANLAGGELLQLANDDKTSKAATQISFTLASAATVYVAVDATISPRPSWLDATWTRDTASVFKWNNAGDTVVTFDVYKKAFAAGTVSLPGNLTGTTGSAHSNYTVIVH
jgi:hypothetical protein